MKFAPTEIVRAWAAGAVCVEFPPYGDYVCYVCCRSGYVGRVEERVAVYDESGRQDTAELFRFDLCRAVEIVAFAYQLYQAMSEFVVICVFHDR